jgi:hypothetical protein
MTAHSGDNNLPQTIWRLEESHETEASFTQARHTSPSHLWRPEVLETIDAKVDELSQHLHHLSLDISGDEPIWFHIVDPFHTD